MEQSNRTRPHLERILLVAGTPKAGKSTLLRHMFVDPRFGTGAAIPTAARIPFVPLSRERCLFVRFSSPHERHETLSQFFRKLDQEMARAWIRFWRFNFACAVQPQATRSTPDLVTICTELRRRLWPERIRIVQIHPQQNGKDGTLITQREVDRLRRLDVEVMTVDGRHPRAASQHPNGLLLADFFDFT